MMKTMIFEQRRKDMLFCRECTRSIRLILSTNRVTISCFCMNSYGNENSSNLFRAQEDNDDNPCFPTRNDRIALINDRIIGERCVSESVFVTT